MPELSEYSLELAPISTQREDSDSILAELEGQPIAPAAMSLNGGVALMCAQPGSASQRNTERYGFRIAHPCINWQ